MVVLRAIGAFFARIGRWIRDTAWVQPLLIVGGIFAIIFSIPSITSWIQSWFVTGDEAVSFYKNNGYLALDDGKEDGRGSSADKLLQYIFNTDQTAEEKAAAEARFGTKFFVTFVQEDCSTCKTIYPGWQSAKDNWGKSAGFKEVFEKVDGQYVKIADAGEFKLYSIFVDQENDNEENYFWQLHDDVYSAQFGELASLVNPYSSSNNVSYENLANSGSTDLSGGSVFSSPTTLLFDKNFTGVKDDGHGGEIDMGYSCDNNGIAKYHVAEVLFDVPSKGSSGTNVEKARTLWDCWHHIGQFDNESDENERYISK